MAYINETTNAAAITKASVFFPLIFNEIDTTNDTTDKIYINDSLKISTAVSILFILKPHIAPQIFIWGKNRIFFNKE